MYKYTKQLIVCTFVAVLLSACGGSSDSGGASPGPSVSNLRLHSMPSRQPFPPSPMITLWWQIPPLSLN